jgi:alanine racemase
MNSGMNRLGFAPSAFRSAWLRLSGLTQVDGITLMTHFSEADVPGSESASHPSAVASQRAVFESIAADLPGERSACNSAAVLRLAQDPVVRGDWIRPGIMLYGSAPDYPLRTAADWQLRPTQTLRSQLIATQVVAAGGRVGYGGAFTAEQRLRIGVVACGYADGYPRSAPTGTPVLVGGVRTRVVGRVSMDMTCFDVTDAPPLAEGEMIAVDFDLARLSAASGRSQYELLTGLGARYARDYR